MGEYIDTNTKIRVWDIGEDGAPHFVNTTVARFLLAHLDTTGLINGIPIADVKPVVRGEWVWTETGDEDYEQFWVCSVCGEHDFYEANYCPNCGARMDEHG